MITPDDVRAVTRDLPRSYEALVHDRVKFKVGRIVYVAFSRDEETIGFGFPKEERQAMVDTRPEVFRLPRPSELRYRWIEARCAALDRPELDELVLDAWRMCVPASVAARLDEERRG